MEWEIEGVGRVQAKNAAWFRLVSLRVRREGKLVEVIPPKMNVGEVADATFKADFSKPTECKVTRIS